MKALFDRVKNYSTVTEHVYDRGWYKDEFPRAMPHFPFVLFPIIYNYALPMDDVPATPRGHALFVMQERNLGHQDVAKIIRDKLLHNVLDKSGVNQFPSVADDQDSLCLLYCMLTKLPTFMTFSRFIDDIKRETRLPLNMKFYFDCLDFKCSIIINIKYNLKNRLHEAEISLQEKNIHHDDKYFKMSCVEAAIDFIIHVLLFETGKEVHMSLFKNADEADIIRIEFDDMSLKNDMENIWCVPNLFLTSYLVFDTPIHKKINIK